MSSGRIENQLLDAIETIVNSAIAKAGYDKTIQATIVRCENESIGKYTIRYQDSLMYAYSNDLDTIYSNDTSVYVLIPSNNTSVNKTILGTVNKLGTDYLDVSDDQSSYEYIGKNCIESSDEFGLCSYTVGGQVKILYDKDENINLINLNTADAELYLKKSDYLICNSAIRTNLNLEQQYAGDYGIVYELVFKNNAEGSNITRSYVFNIDQMHGNPYQLKTAINQGAVYTIDGENFQYINRIYLYEKDFPRVSNNTKPNDIFISNLSLYGASLMPTDENAACSLSLLTPKGIYFDDSWLDTDSIELQTQVRVKNNIISSNSETLKYYWFKENNTVTYGDDKYLKYGGAGWECLNEYTLSINDLNETIKTWQSGNYNLKITKNKNISKITKYKAVVLYNNETQVSREITIYNYSSPYEITLKSDNGENFFYDVGEANLKCYINNAETAESNYTYRWSVTNNNGSFSTLTETSNTLTIAAKDIVSFSIYKCSAYYNNTFIGCAEITLTNSLEGGNNYSLLINNGNQVFKYDTNGISPASNSLTNPITISALSFTLYDKEGRLIPTEAISSSDINWRVPKNNTLINIPNTYTPSETTDDEEIYTGYDELSFEIASKYNARYTNNIITLEVAYKDNLYINTTNLSFLKEGGDGTNGTEYAVKIIPYATDGNIPKKVILTHNNADSSKTSYTLNYQNSGNYWFKIQMWKDGELLYEGRESGSIKEDEAEESDISISWYVLGNKYTKTVQDYSMYSIDSTTGAVDFLGDGDYGESDPVNIIGAEIIYKGLTYYASYPIITAFVPNSTYLVEVPDIAGFNEVIYTTDGREPQYDNSEPFEIDIYKDNEKISGSTYTWTALGTIYYDKWINETKLIEKTRTNLEDYQAKFKPIDENNGLGLSNAIYCRIINNDDTIDIYLPVHMYLNRYGNAAINGWDGNSISMDEDGGLILAPQVGAGKKETDNSFTGVFMGTVEEAGASDTETGLYGYNHGARTFEINSSDGSVKLGASGQGQIVIDPNSGSENHAYLRSGNYELAYTQVGYDEYYNASDLYFRRDENKYIRLKIYDDYNPEQKVSRSDIYKLAPGGAGLEIDLTDPHITFGSGNFRIDSDGRVVASAYATTSMSFNTSSVVGLDDKLDEVDGDITDLKDSTNYLEITVPSNGIQVETDTNKRPSHTATHTLGCTTYYKGDIVQPSEVNITGEYTGITGVSSSYDTEKGCTILSFHVDSATALQNTINTYTVTFSYNEDGCKDISKEISITALIKGADGSSVTIKGTEKDISTLCANHPSGNELGDGYLLDDNGSGEDGHLFIYTNGGSGSGSLETDWKDVGRLRGEDGTDGNPGKSVVSITEYYAIEATQPDASSSEWNTSIPTYEKDKYYWKKTVTKWSDTTEDTIVIIKDEALTTSNKNAYEALDTIENLSIGGRNYILQTDVEKDGDGTGLENECTTLYTFSDYGYNDLIENEEKEFVISFDWITSATSGTFYLQFENTSWGSVHGSPIVISNENQSGHVVSIYTAPVDITSFTSKNIQIRQDNVDGTTSISNLKFESGNKVTNWTPAPEDTDNDLIDTKTDLQDLIGTADEKGQKALELINGIDEEDGLSTQLNILLDTTVPKLQNTIDRVPLATITEYNQIQYTFTKTELKGAIYNKNIVYYDNNYNKIVPTVEINASGETILSKDYYTKATPNTPSADDAKWTQSKPQWKDGYAIFQRQKITYTNDDIGYTTPLILDDYQSIDDIRYLTSRDVINEMRGSTKIFYNKDGMTVYNNETQANSTHYIALNSSGIVFGWRDSQQDEWHYDSVWRIDGSFDATNITVNNLKADSITDGELVLGNTKADGKMVIKDDSDKELISLNSQRSEWILNDNCYVIIGKDTGLQICNIHGIPYCGNPLIWTEISPSSSTQFQNNTNYYTEKGNLLSILSDQSGTITSTVYTVSHRDGFRMKSDLDIGVDDYAGENSSGSINFGNLIQTMNINSTDSKGIKHKGLAFIAKQ